MDLELSEDQRALASGIRVLLSGRFSLDRVRRLEGAGQVVDPDDWAALGEAGVFSLILPQDRGGVGLGLADAAVVFEELGRALVAGPLVGSFLAAEIVEGAAEGLAVAGVVPRAVPDGPGPGALPVVVAHLGSLDTLVALSPPGRDPSGAPRAASAAVIDLDNLEAVPLAQPLDPLTPLWALSGGLPVGTPLGDPGLADRLWHHGTILTAALQIGRAAACCQMAVAYSAARVQFGRPVGSFQAVKHLCADMLVRVEVARAALHAAAALTDQTNDTRDQPTGTGAGGAGMGAGAGAGGAGTGAGAGGALRRAAAGAKLLADQAAIANARAAIQVHGGMGFTWEVPVHLYLKRAHVDATQFGTAGELALELAELL